MSTIRTMRRRRKQMQNGYTHHPAKSRPKYKAANRASLVRDSLKRKDKK